MLGCAVPTLVSGQHIAYTMDAHMPVYTDSLGYGLDFGSSAADVKAHAPYYFSVKVPDGNYRVTLVLGDKKIASTTTVRAESRRLMREHIAVAKGKQTTVEFVVNKRSPQIEGTNDSVRLHPREISHHDWDDRLTLEFTGTPAVKSITLERDTIVPTIYLCGNSTVTDQEEEPWASWGQMVTRWIDGTAAIANHAESGLATSTFLSQKRLDKIMTTLKEGDYVLCEFGHNDMKEHGPGDGAWYNFAHNLKIFIDRARSKGATIVFCTPTQRRTFADDRATINYSHGDYPDAMRQIAAREQVPVIDLNELTRTFFQTLGYENSKKALVHYPAHTFPGQEKPLADNTHFNPYGAYEVAKMVLAEMIRLELPIAKSITPDFTGYDPAQPDSFDTFEWIPAKAVDLTKPLGN
jgi:lysophospholipase L1-like esterase